MEIHTKISTTWKTDASSVIPVASPGSVRQTKKIREQIYNLRSMSSAGFNKLYPGTETLEVQ